MRRSANKTLATKKADKWFSLYIRLRDSIDEVATCCTCGAKHHYKEMDAGHFISRNHQATRYDEQNVHAQCRKCNRFESGHQFKHGQFIDNKYGVGTAEKIEQKSRMMCKRSAYDYEVIAEIYRKKAKSLE